MRFGCCLYVISLKSNKIINKLLIKIRSMPYIFLLLKIFLSVKYDLFLIRRKFFILEISISFGGIKYIKTPVKKTLMRNTIEPIGDNVFIDVNLIISIKHNNINMPPKYNFFPFILTIA